jgi:hypothetical protein
LIFFIMFMLFQVLLVFLLYMFFIVFLVVFFGLWQFTSHHQPLSSHKGEFILKFALIHTHNWTQKYHP